MNNHSLQHFNAKIIAQSIKDAFLMLTPKVQLRNPIIFVAYLGAILTTVYLIHEAVDHHFSWFNFQITLWLWFTVIFANFAESLAENKGRAQAGSLKKTKIEAYARQIQHGIEVKIAAADLKQGDIIICEAGDIIPTDGEIIEGVATIDESAITGESAPVIRESGDERTAVTAGTKLLSDRLVIRVTSEIGNSFLDKMISLIEGAKRQRTPNEIALHIVLSALTIIFLLATLSLKPFSDYSQMVSGQELSHIITIPVLISLLVCLIPTAISALLSAIGIAGIDRLVKKNVIAKSGRSIEAAGDIDLLLIDKTGTITIGNRMATAFLPAVPFGEKEFALIAQLASLSDETPEGRSIVVLAKRIFSLRAASLDTRNTTFIPFSAKTKMSGVDFTDRKGQQIRKIRKGAVEAIKKWIESQGGVYPKKIDSIIETISRNGGTPLLVSDNEKVAGIIHLKDVIKGGIKKRFLAMRKMGIRTVMITGDNPLTAAAIAAEAGVDDYIAEATPEIKLAFIRKEQEEGRLVAMTGDGTNDAPALAQADVAVVMNTGSQASREAGNMVDLDSNPTKLIDIVEISKQLLMTRGALTTFSIANDVAKYFAIVPAVFSSLYMTNHVGPLSVLNVMFLHSPQSAILSAVIFNALTIVALIPVALRGVRYQAKPADELLKHNLLIYGLGGLITPFIAIKGIDLIITLLGWVP